jgi:hypothetical protein
VINGTGSLPGFLDIPVHFFRHFARECWITQMNINLSLH